MVDLSCPFLLEETEARHQDDAIGSTRRAGGPKSGQERRGGRGGPWVHAGGQERGGSESGSVRLGCCPQALAVCLPRCSRETRGGKQDAWLLCES